LYTLASYPYGRFETRVQFAGGDGVVGSFFLWKDGSEQEGVFWNELDLETVWADCEILSNALYGNPEAVHSQSHGTGGAWCNSFHTYAYEWTPDYIAWFIDGAEVRRETGEDNTAFRDNVPDGMQIHFNVWPGDSTFGGNFSPAILPLHQYVNWVQYYSYADGAFTLEWREDFGAGTLPEGWATGDWGSPKGLSTHAAANVAFIDGYAVLSMTADDATGSTGAAPMDPEGGGPIGEPEDPGSGGAGPSVPDDEAPGDPVATGGSPGSGGAAPVGDEPVTGSGGVAIAPGVGGASVGGPSAPPGTPVVGAGGNGAGTPGAPSGEPAPVGAPGTPQPGPVASVPAADDPSSLGGPGPTPNGAPTTPQSAESGASDVTTASPPVMASDTASGSGGGCRTSKKTPSGWASLAMLLGLCAGFIHRRA
jgi:hypothetical protein